VHVDPGGSERHVLEHVLVQLSDRQYVMDSYQESCHSEEKPHGMGFVLGNGAIVDARGSRFKHKRDMPGKVLKSGARLATAVLLSYLTCVAVECLVVQRLHWSHQLNLCPFTIRSSASFAPGAVVFHAL
jgi:hypothetical protein